MDLVYIVRNGDVNEELKMSLRSIDAYAPKFRNIVIVGYKPNWVNDNVVYIPTGQSDDVSGWINARINLIVACSNKNISNNFVLMNDDFILIRPIDSWTDSTLKVRNTLDTQIKHYESISLNSHYTRSFKSHLAFIKYLTGKHIIYNYELHIPMIFCKNKFIDMLKNKKIANMMCAPITLYRTLYGNIYNIQFNEIIDDVKFYDKDPKIIKTEWISVFDGWIGDNVKYPNLNGFLSKRFSKKCKYEV